MKTIQSEEGYPISLFETYLAMIRGSVGSNQYRRLYVLKPGGIYDVINDGDLACAYFVSSVLTLCELLKLGVHSNVTETVLDLISSGWVEQAEPCEGAVIVWGPKMCSDGMQHRHIGFYIGQERAISNIAKLGRPGVHHFTYNGARPIESIYFHEKLR